MRNEKSKELERLYDEGDMENYTIKVHALKSSARIIGASDFGDRAQKLEDAGKNADIGYIKANNDPFVEEYRTFKKPLAEIFAAEDDDTDRPEADEDLMADVFSELRSAADDMDCDRLQAIFKEMEEYRIPGALAVLWKGLRETADNYDYEGVLELIDNDASS